MNHAELGVVGNYLGGNLLQISDQNDDVEIQRERHFELNLKRMLGKCEAVTVDYMLEFLVHLNNQHLGDLQFIEEEYISLVLMDEKLNLAVCSVEYLILKYEEAKKKKNETFLRALRDCHREARKMLECPETKAKIESFLVTRKAKLKRQRFFKILNPMASYFETYGTDDYVGEMLESWLPLLTSQQSMREIEGLRPCMVPI